MKNNFFSDKERPYTSLIVEKQIDCVEFKIDADEYEVVRITLSNSDVAKLIKFLKQKKPPISE